MRRREKDDWKMSEACTERCKSGACGSFFVMTSWQIHMILEDNMQHTSQYQLNQWAKTDRIQMEDFNTDNLKIEQALAALADSLTGKADSAAVGALQAALANVSPVVKLLSVTLGNSAANWDIPVGTLDFDQYTAFLIYPSFQTSGNDPIYLRLNSISDTCYSDNGKSKNYFLSLNGPQGYTHQVVLRKAQTYFTALGQRFGYAGYEAATAGGVELTTISGITSLTFAASTTETSLLAGSRVTMYGLKT